MFRKYTDSQIDKLGNQNFNKLVQKEARREIPFVAVGFEEAAPYAPELFRWEPEAPDDVHCKQCNEPMCLKCYKWRRYGPGQRHFGYTFWRQCEQSCECSHHNHEIWIA